MAILRYICGVAVAVALAGCETDFTPSTTGNSVLCLNSLITAGEPIEVDVSHTWFYADYAGQHNHKVNDASVIIFANNVQVAPDYIPREGDVIRILASSKTYGDAEAEVTVPRQVPIEKLEFQPRATLYSQEDIPGEISFDVWFNFDIYLTLNDIPGEENYFHYQSGASK